MSITAGRVLLVVGVLGVLGVQSGGWSLGIALGPPEFRAAHASAPFFVLCLALLLIAVGVEGRGLPRWAGDRLLTAGAVLYAAGALLQFFGSGFAWLLPIGAWVASIGILTPVPSPSAEARLLTRRLLTVVALGLVLEGLLALNTVDEFTVLRGFLGGEDELRQRLLRLARVAALILPLLALLGVELRERAPVEGRAARVTGWLTAGLALGAAGMPLVLILSALVDLRWKYLLPVPADLTLAGTITGAWLAFRHGFPRERVGWLLIAASMSVGMLMGGYAFEGPLPSPVGNYAASTRTLLRNWHAATIVLGILLILSKGRAPRIPSPNSDLRL